MHFLFIIKLWHTHIITRAAWTAVEPRRPPMHTHTHTHTHAHTHNALDFEACSSGFWHRLCNTCFHPDIRLRFALAWQFACISKKVNISWGQRSVEARKTNVQIYTYINLCADFDPKEPLARSEFTPAVHLVIPHADRLPTAGSPQRDHLITKVKKLVNKSFKK